MGGLDGVAGFSCLYLWNWYNVVMYVVCGDVMVRHDVWCVMLWCVMLWCVVMYVVYGMWCVVMYVVWCGFD